MSDAATEPQKPAGDNRVNETINQTLAEAGRKMETVVNKKLQNAVEEAVNPPWYKQGTLYGGIVAGIFTGLVLANVLSDGEKQLKAEHARALQEQGAKYTQLFRQQTAKHQKIVNNIIANQGTPVRLARDIVIYDGKEVSFPLLLLTEKPRDEVREILENIGERLKLAPLGEESIVSIHPEYASDRIVKLDFESVLQSPEGINAFMEALETIRKDAALRTELKIAYRFKLDVDPQQSTLTLLRDTDANRKGMVEIDAYTIK